MGNPKILEVNGDQIIQGIDGKFGIYDYDDLKAGPFDTEQEAAEAAYKLPSRNPSQPS